MAIFLREPDPLKAIKDIKLLPWTESAFHVDPSVRDSNRRSEKENILQSKVREGESAACPANKWSEKGNILQYEVHRIGIYVNPPFFDRTPSRA